MTFIVALFRFATAFFALAGTSKTWLMGETQNLVYFTHQTNLLIAAVFVWAGCASILRGVQPPAWLKGALTLNIIITGLVAWLVLPPANPATQFYVFGIASSTMVHIIVPIMASLDFLLFDEHRRFKWLDSLTWLIYFPVYLAFILIRAKVFHAVGPESDGSPYPYGFINLDKLGLQHFVTNCAMYLAIFFVLALIMVVVDKALPQRTALTGSSTNASRLKKVR
ncbi:Pr6Pr family membrane protein [Alloscardovia omnicolens]|uniref:Pr6Pr family membrane protein n=1 Tax=Alloscardovia omnicolens TaxID=419015 RepID=UPI003A6ADCF4